MIFRRLLSILARVAPIALAACATDGEHEDDDHGGDVEPQREDTDKTGDTTDTTDRTAPKAEDPHQCGPNQVCIQGSPQRDGVWL